MMGHIRALWKLSWLVTIVEALKNSKRKLEVVKVAAAEIANFYSKVSTLSAHNEKRTS